MCLWNMPASEQCQNRTPSQPITAWTVTDYESAHRPCWRWAGVSPVNRGCVKHAVESHREVSWQITGGLGGVKLCALKVCRRHEDLHAVRAVQKLTVRLPWQFTDEFGGVGLRACKVRGVRPKRHLRCSIQVIARQGLQRAACHRDSCATTRHSSDHHEILQDIPRHHQNKKDITRHHEPPWTPGDITRHRQKPWLPLEAMVFCESYWGTTIAMSSNETS